MINFCVYSSDPERRVFEFMQGFYTEKEARQHMAKMLITEGETGEDTGFKQDTHLHLFLFKGKDNFSGALLLSVTLQVYNKRPRKK
jgi:hypothetical protein